MFKHILVPVDGSELSDDMLLQACSFARETNARITFYHAKPAYFPATIAGEVMFDDVAAYDTFRAAVDKQAESILKQAAGAASNAGVECETLSSECESTHQGIIAAAESGGCDLIYMASHGRRGASALLLGSETHKVLTHCKTPVLVHR
ncbi:MAG: universal stress protein [Pseudomonadota bacterium]|nr:universal stress protein [Pseudomonadota bacterium]MDP1905099.1 universal stress protein [Pseudomonadota bacterium]MDP2354410.1 universal stress protein [Pseudomonadota bacterium]